MHLTRRHIQDTSDLLRIAEFIYAYPSMSPHVIDQPYRLTSYSVERPQNVVLWEDEQEQLMAYAFMQEPFLELDYAIHSRALSLDLEVEAYVALHRAAFDSGHMQIQWRQRSLRMPQYVPELYESVGFQVAIEWAGYGRLFYPAQ